jgi:Rieske Fe-S protein
VKVVVTQPSEGELKVFTAFCTQLGCIVSSVQAGGIRCECHGSAFSIEDGSAVNPPATVGLDEVEITVEGDEISIA